MRAAAGGGAGIYALRAGGGESDAAEPSVILWVVVPKSGAGSDMVTSANATSERTDTI